MIDILNPDSLAADFFGQEATPDSRFACTGCELGKSKKKCCKKFKKGKKQCKSCPKR